MPLQWVYVLNLREHYMEKIRKHKLFVAFDFWLFFGRFIYNMSTIIDVLVYNPTTMIPRFLENDIIDALFLGKTIVLYGARQVGKTTLIKKILLDSGKRTRFFDAESIVTRQIFREEDFEMIRKSVEGYDIVAIDEAQKIENIGSILKLMHDHIPEVQVIATGSSSFDLAQKTRESMAGRVREFFMSPLLLSELLSET